MWLEKISPIIKITIIGAFIVGAILLAGGIIVALKGKEADSHISILGQEVKTLSVGIGLAFIGAMLIFGVIKKTINTFENLALKVIETENVSNIGEDNFKNIIKKETTHSLIEVKELEQLTKSIDLKKKLDAYSKLQVRVDGNIEEQQSLFLKIAYDFWFLTMKHGANYFDKNNKVFTDFLVINYKLWKAVLILDFIEKLNSMGHSLTYNLDYTGMYRSMAPAEISMKRHKAHTIWFCLVSVYLLSYPESEHSGIEFIFLSTISNIDMEKYYELKLYYSNSKAGTVAPTELIHLIRHASNNHNLLRLLSKKIDIPNIHFNYQSKDRLQ